MLSKEKKPQSCVESGSFTLNLSGAKGLTLNLLLKGALSF